MATAATQHIEVMPGVCGGRPRIARHRIRVQDIYVWHERMGKSPDEIVSEFPQLTLADVYAALAWFCDHRDELLEDMKRQDAFVEEMKTKYPSKLRERLKVESWSGRIGGWANLRRSIATKMMSPYASYGATPLGVLVLRTPHNQLQHYLHRFRRPAWRGRSPDSPSKPSARSLHGLRLS